MSDYKADLSPFCMRARGFIGQGRIEDALGLYGDVLTLDPNYALAYADRGTAYAMMEKFDLALADLERAVALDYIDASLYSTAATIYFQQKQHQKALAYFTKAIELDPDYTLAYYNRSNTLYEIGEHEAAIADLEKCLTAQPDENFKQLILRRLAFIRAQQV